MSAIPILCLHDNNLHGNYTVAAYWEDDGDNINLIFRSIVSLQWSWWIIRKSIRRIIRMDSFSSIFRMFMDPSEQMTNNWNDEKLEHIW